MNQFEPRDAVILFALVLLTVAISLPTGWRKGSGGAPFDMALVSGFGRTLIVIMAVTTLVGVGVARYRLGKLAEDELWVMKGSGVFGRLHETDVDWLLPDCTCRWCRSGRRGVRPDELREFLITREQRSGYVLPFLAPVYGLLALIPSIIATAVGYNIGARRRVVRLMAEMAGEGGQEPPGDVGSLSGR